MEPPNLFELKMLDVTEFERNEGAGSHISVWRNKNDHFFISAAQGIWRGQLEVDECRFLESPDTSPFLPHLKADQWHSPSGLFASVK